VIFFPILLHGFSDGNHLKLGKLWETMIHDNSGCRKGTIF
jgi:hypothetical protein